MFRTTVTPLLKRPLFGALLAFQLGAATALAQEVRRPEPDCGPRMCVRAPCPQPPPCPVREAVERTARDVRITLEGRVLRYEVTEQWTNHGSMIGEADYVLPLPRGAAFEDLALEIDGEMVTGEALAAGEARRIYEEIVRRRRDPALVEWMGLGVLRTRIFPIQPGETRTVKVRFRAVAEREGDALRVDVPAPRGSGARETGVRGSGVRGRGTAIALRWPAGEGFGEVWSPTHKVVVAREGSLRVARVEDATGTVTLLVPVRTSGSAAISVLTHAPATDEGYALITLTPPAFVRRATARDVTFVIDVSGSMGGGKLEQAKAAGRQLLGSLSGTDRFRLISFSNDVDEFREGWTTASGAARSEAGRWLDELRASGGTNIQGALERALDDEESTGRLALVLFLTDGAPTVGERRAERLAARAAELRGARRVFTFGLGADVNASLLEQVALDGAGTAHFVRPEEDVERVVGVVAERLTRPVATNLRVRAAGVQLSALQPAGRLDLFAGQELTILARYRARFVAMREAGEAGDEPRGTGGDPSGGEADFRGASGTTRITITGDTPDGPVTWTATARFPARRTADAFVGRLWATQRVGWLSAERRKNGASSEVDREIRALGERWGIPTELTSYLVLEPGMDRTAMGNTGGVAPLGRGRADRLDATTVTGVAPASAPATVAKREFEGAKQAAEMRSARSLADVSGSVEESAGARLRRTATRTFVLRDSAWVDARPEAAGARRESVRPYSAAYFALMERLPELREVFALGERVEVHGRAVTLVLAADGHETLADAALAAIARDW